MTSCYIIVMSLCDFVECWYTCIYLIDSNVITGVHVYMVVCTYIMSMHVRAVEFLLLLLVPTGELCNLVGTILGGQSGENISLEQVSGWV